jgi:hypothetical protein
MDRIDFLKSASLTTLGLSTGIINPTSLFAEDKTVFSKSLKLTNQGVIDMTVENEQIFEWLLKAVGTALISALVGKIVNYYSGGTCYCNGSSCSKNNANSNDYSNTVGYYGYSTHNQKFLTQQIYDNNTSFVNVSVPFVDNRGYKISNVEGPFLAGLCFAAEDIKNKYGTMMARNVIIPYAENSNGGYRFDASPCYPTVLKTNYGTTAISYTPDGSYGYVKVDAYNRIDRLMYSEEWKMNAV